MTTTRKELQLSRGKLNALIVRAMRRDGFDKLTEWLDHHGLARSTFYSMIRGREASSGAWIKPSLDTLATFATALGVPLHDLIYLLMPDAPGAPAVHELAADLGRFPPTTYVPVEVAGWVGAGPEQNEAELETTIPLENSFVRARALRAFRIRGDSMAAGKEPIYDGDTVIVHAGGPFENSDAVVARLRNDHYVCKVYKNDRYGELLQSRNVDHTNGTPSAIPIADVSEIVGRVVRVIHEKRTH